MSFTSNLNWRYSVKKFSGAKVPEENVKTILESIRLAPSSYGIQPFHITVISENKELREDLKKSAWGQEQLTTASHVLVFSALSNVIERVDQYIDLFSGGIIEKKEALKGFETMAKGALSTLTPELATAWAKRQAYIALGFGLATCAEMNIDSCPMEGFDNIAFKKILGLSENLNPAVLLTIGYRDPSDTALPKTRFSESELFDFR
ncbi:MAG: NAD(P)H-dependent oxidoreductase [bacterium]|nr:NAD(P)H-dependent oxidoreductase [bacterium]